MSRAKNMGLAMLAMMALFALVAPGVAAEPSTAAATPAAVSAKPQESPSVDHYVAEFNPDIYRLDDQQKPVFPGRSLFAEPSSDVARRVLSVTWFSAFIFLPFLILPMILLLVVIFRFRDRGDGRKPAAFLTNHKLEVMWTLIPFLALAIVSGPTWYVLDYMDSPSLERQKDMQVVTVTGHQFKWDYEYKRYFKDPTAGEKECVKVGTDGVSLLQEPLLLVKDRTVTLNLSSNDVNHAWWIPAFGVKKDAIKGRFTNVWFTPDTLGTFKGQCAELCGSGHGNMIITAVVVEEADFQLYISLLRHRDDTLKVWNALQPGPGKLFSPDAVKAAIAVYLAKGDSAERQFALSYWMASNYASLQRVPPSKEATLATALGLPASVGRDQERIDGAIRAKRKLVDDQLSALNKKVADASAPATLVALQ